MIDERTIERAAEVLLAAAPPGSFVILFGSHARGQAGPDSDLDFLVVEPAPKCRLREMVRLRDALEPVIGPERIGADVLVVAAETFEYWRDTPNTVYHAAAQEGRTFGKVA